MKKTLLIYVALILFFGIAIAGILHYGTLLESHLFSGIIAPAASIPSTISDTFLKQLHHPLPLLLIQFIVIMIVTRLFGYLVSFVAQPTVVGEIVAGIILGPSLMGALFPDMFIALFPKESLGNLHLISQLGLIFFMFVVGMELDFDKIKKQSSASVFISHVSIIFPFSWGWH